MLGCVLDFNIGDLQLPDIEAMLVRMEPVFRLADGDEWHIDCRGCHYLGPSAAVLLATAAHEGRRKGQRPMIELPAGTPQLRAFCTFSGLAQLVAGGARPDPSHPKNETAPLHNFQKESYADSTPLVDLVRRHVPALDGDSEDILRRCFAEVAQNVADHAQSPIGGVACARFMTATSEVRLAFADRGLGIVEKLRRSHPTMPGDEQRLLAVLAGKVSSKSRKNNMGLGIHNLATIARGHSGKLMIVSNDWAAIVQPTQKEPRVQRLRATFPGTAVFMSLTVAPAPDDEGGSNDG